MCIEFGRFALRFVVGTLKLSRIGWLLAGIAVAVGLAVPTSPLWAKTDCASLDVELAPLAEFTNVECDEADFRHRDASYSEELIGATSSTSVFFIHHLKAGVLTYFERRDTKTLLEGLGDFASMENWSAAPGGNKFLVARFRGALSNRADVELSCFGFSRFTGHVARSSGYRHLLYGFYCALQSDDISDADVRRLMAALKFEFE